MDYVKLVPDQETATLLGLFWDMRGKVKDENRCPTPLIRDGVEERCVLDVNHLKSDVPHATEDGHLAPILVRQSTIRAAEALAEHDRKQALAEENCAWVRKKVAERGLTPEIQREAKLRLFDQIFGTD